MVEPPAQAPGPARRSRLFVLGYGAAQAGAFIAFIPLLTLLLPGKADAIGGASREILLGQAAMIGGLTAAAANLVFGALSDHRHGRFGRRRPWILAGLVMTIAALALIALADRPAGLLVSIVLFQIAVNALYAPLVAVIPDQVPDGQKGLVSAWAGGALPIANLFTALVVTGVVDHPFAPFAVVMVATTALVLPFALTLREPEIARPAPFRMQRVLIALADRNFRRAFGSRLMVESAVAVHTLYLLFLVQNTPQAALPDGWEAPQVFSVLLILSTVSAALAGFLAGVASDRMRHRRAFVIVGAVSIGLGLCTLGLSTTWPTLLTGQLLFGAGHGVHAAVVAAMTAEILPDRARAGRDLGVMNVAVALPQALAPGIAALLIVLGAELPLVFIVSGAAALAACALLIRRWEGSGLEAKRDRSAL